MTTKTTNKDGQVEECKNIFVSWSKFTTMILSFIALALLISFTFGATEVGIKKDISTANEKIINHESRLRVLEEQKIQLENISKKLDQLLQRK